MKINYKLLWFFIIIQIFFSCDNNSSISNSLLEKKIGQLLLIGFQDTIINKNDILIQQIKNNKIGGLLLYKRNISSYQQVEKLLHIIKIASNNSIFIAIDQEGGNVQRLNLINKPLNSPSAEYLGYLDDLDTTKKYAKSTAYYLKTLGFNMNFAPVVDLKLIINNPISWYSRSFSKDPEIVVKHSIPFIIEHNNKNIATVLKHFPGLGSSLNDTHNGFADVAKNWNKINLIPFKKIIDSGFCNAIMIAHLFNKTFDDKYPASLSKRTINYLRDTLNFNGVILSDDMQMKAITNDFTLEQSIFLGLNAGIDIFIFSNNSFDQYLPDKFNNIINGFIKSGIISIERIDSSIKRIKYLKRKMKLHYISE